jgi:lon-related putative ATP-dependent protease
MEAEHPGTGSRSRPSAASAPGPGAPKPASPRTDLEVPPQRLRRRLDPAGLPFQTTAEVEPLQGTIGQPRALGALEFGAQTQGAGYNLFASGTPGSGRLSTVREHLERLAATRPAPDAWVYVHDFERPDCPRAIRLPAGLGRRFAVDMDEFLEHARRRIAQAFEDEHYGRRRQEIVNEAGRRRESLLEELQRFAAARGFMVELTPGGIVAIPLAGGRPLPAEAVRHMSETEREELERRSGEVQEEVQGVLRRLNQVEREAGEQIRRLDREVALFALDPLFHELRERYAGQAEVLAHLEAVREDIPDHLADFRREPAPGPPPAGSPELLAQQHLARYRVNVLVDQGDRPGAPIVLELNPTYYNLLGRVEYRASFGMLVTDFLQIKAGALHRANGGFLILEALDVLRNPFAWDALKRALISRQIRIENLGEQFSPVPTASLTPEPISLDVKVVLIGSPLLYRLLYELDEQFRELFKVKVDFAPDMEWSQEHVSGYAAFISRCIRSSGLRHFDRSAVARVVEHGSRLREHQGKLSARLLDISNIVDEASFWAGQAGHEVVQAEDVERAIAEKEYRSNLVEERIREAITEGTVLIDTEGMRVGQVNGLTVIDLGDHRFGMPARVTARVSLGRGSVVSVEREIELSGPIHSKGFLIVSGYLAQQYAQEHPLAVHATLTFEQSYDEVEGDSASSTELYTLLSALSGLPLDQGIAVTGSVNQHGEIQAVGGVTEKIEGFYRLCQARGLNGRQGVIIPAANVQHLSLSEETLAAVAAGRFHVWAVRTVDEGIELLTGRPAGQRQADGSFPEGSVHRLVDERLGSYAERLRSFSVTPDGGPRER